MYMCVHSASHVRSYWLSSCNQRAWGGGGVHSGIGMSSISMRSWEAQTASGPVWRTRRVESVEDMIGGQELICD